jgi:hypothetical protein
MNSLVIMGDAIVLVERDTLINRYTLFDRDGQSILVGPFDSHPSAEVVAQAIANRSRRNVRLESGLQAGRVYSPEA